MLHYLRHGSRNCDKIDTSAWMIIVDHHKNGRFNTMNICSLMLKTHPLPSNYKTYSKRQCRAPGFTYSHTIAWRYNRNHEYVLLRTNVDKFPAEKNHRKSAIHTNTWRPMGFRYWTISRLPNELSKFVTQCVAVYFQGSRFSGENLTTIYQK